MQTVNLRMAESGKAMNCHSQVPRRGILRTASALGLFVLLSIVLSASPLRAEPNVTPQVARILAEIREAPNWDWLSEHSEVDPLSHDHMNWIAWENHGRPEVALQALRIAIQDEDVLIRRAVVGISSRLWRVDARLPGISDIMVGALSDPDDLVRRDAAYELGKSGETEIAIPVLIESLDDPDPAVRLTAALGLQEVGHDSEPAMEALIEALHDSDANVRREAAAALIIGMEREPVVRALADLLVSDPEAEVRVAAVQSLHRSHEKRGEPSIVAIPALIGALTDPDEWVRHRAIRILGTYEDTAGPATPYLVERLLDEDEKLRVRMAAASLLGEVWSGAGGHQNSAVAALVAALDDPNDRIRNNVAHALGAVGPAAEAAIPRLTEMIMEDGACRGAAGHALGRIGPASAFAIPVLAAAFWSEDPDTAWGATNGLIGIGPEAVSAAMPTLVEVIRDGNEHQRTGALRGIREFGTASHDVLPEIVRVAEDPLYSETSRVDALWTIITIAENVSNSEALRVESLEAMIEIAADESNSERLRADALRPMAGLYTIAEPALPVLRQIYETGDGRVRSYARGALHAMGAL